MKVVVISSYFLPYLSGAITSPAVVLRHWARSGHEVHVYCFRHDPRLPVFEEIDGIRVHRLPFLCRVAKGFVSLSYPWRMRRALGACDLVVLNQPVFEGALLVDIARSHRVPVVSLHNCDVELGAGPYNRVLTTALRASVRYQMLRSDAVVSYSAEYANSRPLPPRVRRVLRIIPPAIAPPPVDGTAQSRFAAAKGARCWVGACGRVSREKGLDRLAMAHGALTTPDVELVFAGPCGPEVVGEQDCFASLRERLRSRAVPHRFLGTLEHAALGAFYHAIDCLVLPSTNCTESFGLVQVEAMHCGTPVVAADLPGVSVPVARTGLGRLFPPGDVAALARAIDAVLANPRPAPGTAAAALRAFAPEVVCAEWDRLAAELTAGPAGRDRR